MLGSYSMNFILLYLICGFTTAFIGIYLLRWHFLGHTFGAITVGVIGSFLGALLSTIIIHNSISVPGIAVALVFSAAGLYIYSIVSRYYPD